MSNKHPRYGSAHLYTRDRFFVCFLFVDRFTLSTLVSDVTGASLPNYRAALTPVDPNHRL